MKRPEARRNPQMTRRGLVLLGIQAGVIGLLGWRMRDLQVEQADEFRLLAEENRINIRLLPPARGLIYDRNGKILAENRQNYRVTIVREQAGDVGNALRRLARLIPLTVEEQAAVLKEVNRRSAFVPITVTEHLTWEEVARVAANAPSLPGITPEVGLTRHYPDGAPVAHVVGYVGPVSERDLEKLEDPDPVLQIPKFQIGKTGIEQRVEDELRGEAGNSRIEVNAVGRVMREIDRHEGISGKDLHLTIDQGLQKFALERMAGESAAAVAIELATGDIVASASAPSFDPNDFVFGISTTKWNALLNNDHRPLSNKPVSGAYPPGSTFKMVVALAAQEAGVLSPGETIYCPGFYRLGNRRFHCWKSGGHGHVNLNGSLKGSCDVFYYKVAERVGVDKIAEMAVRLGMGTKHDLPLPAVSEGLAPTREWKKRTYDQSWQLGDTLNVGIGQGYMLATPLQLALMAARIATGKQLQPRLIRAVEGIPVPVEEPADLGISPNALDHVRKGMYSVVNDPGGTAGRSKIAIKELAMAGKTGTSQVRIITADERARGVTRNEDLPWGRRDHALFVCYAPYDNPRYAVSVVVEHGGGGSAVAAPIARDILLYALYGELPPLEAYPPGEREKERVRRETVPQAVAPEAPETATPPETGPMPSDRA
jgi:penicillin-binding protein 2